MGSIVELNDTLQITKDQGFPAELDIAKHLLKPFRAEDFSGKVFTFRNKPSIRIYHMPPVRNFFVENVGGKWIYWGLVHIQEVILDYRNKVTGGTFEIVYINTPEEMKEAHRLIDQNPKTAYFA